VVPEHDPVDVAAAKQANQIPFRNYIPVQKQNDDPRKKDRVETEKMPRRVSELVDDLHRRFLGFPRKVGEQLFDHDRDTGEIYYINKVPDLFSWIGRKSKHPVEWTRGDAMADRCDFLSATIAEALRYESISHVPDWPKRSDVYYIHPQIPKASREHAHFAELIRFFSAASEADERMLMAYFAAPLWFVPRVSRPSWIIDSEDGQGTGKTTIAEACALLYGAAPVRTCQAELQYGTQEITKRLLCANGRNARILLVDNVVGTFTSPVLADLITGWTVSGKRPYGSGEETRPNNLTYTITANNATVDTDIASRSFYIFVQRPQFDVGWKTRLLTFVDKFRYHIIADIIDILEAHKPFQDTPPSTRFAEFETLILQAMCEFPYIYQATLAHLGECRTESNIEEEQAKSIEDLFRSKLSELGINPETQSVWIRSQVVNSWGRLALMDGHDCKGQPIQLIRSLSKQRLLRMVDPRVKRFPHNRVTRSSGVLWNSAAGEAIFEIVRNGDGFPEKRLA
jgi:hypothetical protein